MESLPVFVSVPPEIWFKILGFVLWDDIIFDPDPVSSSPQPHLALRSWHNTERTLEISKRRFVLRSVSRTWRDIVDTLPSYHFQSTETNDATTDEFSLQRAHRLQLGTSTNRSNRGNRHCCKGYNYWNLSDSAESGTSSILADHMSSIDTLRAEILIIPRSEWNALMKKPLDDVRQLLSKVRALLIEYSGFIPTDIPMVCPNITFLAIHAITDLRGYSGIIPSAFSSLSTLQLFINTEECLNWVGKWGLPSLRYLELATTLDAFQECLPYFLNNVGQELISLQISDASNPIHFLGDIWDILPRVRYLGLTMSILPPPPPPNHPLQVFSNREHGHYRSWRDHLKIMAEKWVGVQCISDAHTWDCMAKEFLDLQHDLTSPDIHSLNKFCICSRCVYSLYIACEKRGVRYEDEYGRTWAEYNFGEWGASTQCVVLDACRST
ncbi:hypothetical protein FRC20_004400 [Serendipita sp. 405]|nr:hypothetical protein FRC20_004400 [Serendipita sp. 405]